MVRIGRDNEHVDLLVRERGRPLTATVVAGGLRASHEVEPNYADQGFGDLAEYFTDLGRSWRGWDGERAWRSLEGELSFDARHTGSHILLGIDLRNGPLDQGAEWTTRLEPLLDAGEELSRAVAAIRALAA